MTATDRPSLQHRHILMALAASLGLASASVAMAQVSAPSGSAVTTRNAEIRLGYEQVGLPRGETMGLVGTTYLIGLGHGFAVGPAVYGAISGHRGGLFTLAPKAPGTPG